MSSNGDPRSGSTGSNIQSDAGATGALSDAGAAGALSDAGAADALSDAGAAGALSAAGSASETANGGASFSGAPSVSSGGVASSEAGSGGDGGRAGDAPVTVPVDARVVTSIVTSPLALTPSFAASISDYYVRCAAGDNALTLTTTDDTGTTAQPLILTPGQEVPIDNQYWIRCLPPDFPSITVTRPGTPTPGYYLMNSATYGVVFNADGVPVWYAHGSRVLNVESPAPNTLSLMPDYTPDLGNDSSAPFQVRSLANGLVNDVGSPSGQTDVHEIRTLANGDYLLFTAPLTTGVDLTGLQSFGADSGILDCEIEEVSPSGELVWSWLASAHVDAALESVEPQFVATPSVFVDVFHCNSIDVDDAGNLMISMRHANAVYYINRSTGQIEWKLGGTAYNKDGAALIAVQGDAQTTFTMQHDARFRPNGNVSLFDDHSTGTGVARGIEYAIDHEAGTATPVFQFLGTAASAFQGSFRRYADGDSVIGWGYVPNDPRTLTEVDATGKEVFDIAFGVGNVSYRAVKVPLAQLDIALMRSNAGK